MKRQCLLAFLFVFSLFIYCIGQLIILTILEFHHLAPVGNSEIPVGNSERNVPPRPAVKSLTHLCIAKLRYLFQSTENIEITGYDVLELPHIKTSIWEYCVENARTLAHWQASGLLALALKGEAHINLAHFHDLTPAAVRHVLKSCPEAVSINLSGTAAMADHEIKKTLAAIDHDLEALYLLTHPYQIVGTLPKEVMRALRNWNHRCSKVLISSVLAAGSRGPIPISISLSNPRRQVLHQLVWNRTHCVGSKSFPITQIIYQSTFDNRYRPILAHVFLGGGFVSPPRLWSSILETIRNMNCDQQKETLQFAKFLMRNLVWGSRAVGSDKFYEVHSIPMEATFAVYKGEPEESIYSDPGLHMCNLTPDAWTAVVLRDEIPKDPSSQDGLNRRIGTDRFRMLLLRPKQLIMVEESQSISAFSFHIRDYSSFSNPGPSEASQVLTCGPRRTVIQFGRGPHDVVDTISAVQTVLNAAAAERKIRKKWERPRKTGN